VVDLLRILAGHRRSRAAPRPPAGCAEAEAVNERARHVHSIEWTPERIERFWNFYSANAAAHGNYFSKQFGVRFSPWCGDGASRGPVWISVAAPDTFWNTSCGTDLPARRSTPRRKQLPWSGPDCKGGRVFSAPLWAGWTASRSPTARRGGLLVEVMEHLTPDQTVVTYAEISRILRPGGHLIITVPNAEDLEANSVACPECGCVFHRMQHLQRFTAESLAQRMTAADSPWRSRAASPSSTSREAGRPGRWGVAADGAPAAGTAEPESRGRRQSRCRMIRSGVGAGPSETDEDPRPGQPGVPDVLGTRSPRVYPNGARSRRVRLENIGGILVAVTTALGDSICFTPALDALRSRFPRARIVGLFHRAFAELYRQDPRLDAVIPYEASMCGGEKRSGRSGPRGASWRWSHTSPIRT